VRKPVLRPAGACFVAAQCSSKLGHRALTVRTLPTREFRHSVAAIVNVVRWERGQGPQWLQDVS